MIAIDLLDGSPETEIQLMAVMQYGLNAAAEAELVSPDNETAIRAWMKAERFRLRDEVQSDPQRDHLRESRWFEFWSTLEPEQEVRWTQTKSATYFVVTGVLETQAPDSNFYRAAGPFVELCRHSGKTFWSHIAQVRPLGWIKDR